MLFNKHSTCLKELMLLLLFIEIFPIKLLLCAHEAPLVIGIGNQ